MNTPYMVEWYDRIMGRKRTELDEMAKAIAAETAMG